MNVLTILNELAASAGQDAVRAACTQFLGGKKVKKERKPRGKSSWNLEVDTVLGEMRAALVTAGESEEGVKKKATYKMAYAEASRRRRENNPEAQAKYEAKHGPLLPSVVVESPPLAVDAATATATSPTTITTNPISTIATNPTATTTNPTIHVEALDEMDYGDTDDEGIVIDGVPDKYDAQTVYRFLFALEGEGTLSKSDLQREFGMTKQEADDVGAEYTSRHEELKAKYALPAAPQGPIPTITYKTPQRRISTTVLPIQLKKDLLPVGRTKIPIL
jgi:hypothetical protein